MKSSLISSFQDFQKVLVVCPGCGEIHRLSELKLSYRGRFRKTWLDELREEENKITRAEERFEEKKERIREEARGKGRKQVPKLLKKCMPVICAHGYYPQDLKVLFDPVDFVIFDGLNLKENVRKVVFFDGPPYDRKREKIQKSIRATIKKGNYEWRTVKLDKEGHILE